MKKNKLRQVLITVSVVIIGISAIGWFVWKTGQIFLNLVKVSPAEEPAVESELLVLPELHFWICQAGVFQDKSNAESLAEHIQTRGWKAQIINEKTYKVAVGLFDTKEKAELQKDVLAQEGLEVWIRDEFFPALHYRVKGTNTSAVSAALKTVNSLLRGIPKEEAKDLLAGDLNCIFPDALDSLNLALFEVLNKDYQRDEQGTYYQDLLALYVEYRAITTKFLPIN